MRYPKIDRIYSATTKRGQKGLKVDGVSYRLGNVRKSDGVMVWRCCTCHCTLESTANLKIIKTSDHKSASCRPIPPAPDALHADTVPRPHFVETQKKKTALVFEKKLVLQRYRQIVAMFISQANEL